MKTRFWVVYAILVLFSAFLGCKAFGQAPKIVPPKSQPSGFVTTIDDQFVIVGHEKRLTDLQKELKESTEKILATDEGKHYSEIMKQINQEAQNEVVDTDKIIAKHQWKAVFNMQTQSFEVKP